MTKKRKLRKGFTTGAAAAAAVKGALTLLTTGKKPEKVRIHFLCEGYVDIPVKTLNRQKNNLFVCTVIKDGGDDPDITNKAEIGAAVTIRESKENKKDYSVIITGGKGVGKVTKPGLEVNVGEYAINSGPVKMIKQAVAEVISESASLNSFDSEYLEIHIEIFVPKGEKLAEKTLNDRLGIIGGISILGTTGVVKPMSHEAYVATIKSSLSVAKAGNSETVVLTTGRRSERFSQNMLTHLSDDAFIQIGDFFKVSMEEVNKLNFKVAVIAVFFGKALKMAQGFPHTHAGKSELTMKQLSAWTKEITNNNDLVGKIAISNTARHAFSFLNDDYKNVISFVGRKVVKSARTFAGNNLEVKCIIFDFDGKPVFYE